MPDRYRAITGFRGLVMLWWLGHQLASRGLLPNVLRQPVALGDLGIDVLFVLSGFVLVGSYSGLTLAGTPLFVARRLARVYPTNFVLTGIVAAFAWAHLNIGVLVSWPALPVALAMAGAAAATPQHSWLAANRTVGLGLACWLAFPALLLLLRRAPTWLLSVGSVALAWGETRAIAADPGLWWGYSAVVRAAVAFTLGALLGMLVGRVRRQWLLLTVPAELVVAGGIAAAIAHRQQQPLVLWAAASLPLLWSRTGIVSWTLSNSALMWCGRLAFTVYMTSPIVVGACLMPIQHLANVLPPLMRQWFVPSVLIASVYATAWLVWRTVELPVRTAMPHSPSTEAAAPTRNDRRKVSSDSPLRREPARRQLPRRRPAPQP